jgi:hypothetical protein
MIALTTQSEVYMLHPSSNIAMSVLSAENWQPEGAQDGQTVGQPITEQ